MVKFILVLGMLFSLFTSNSYAMVVNRIVAYVDNYAITLDDFETMAKKMKEKMPDIKNEEIINIMINRAVLLKKAKELFIDGKDEELINSYIDLKIKSTIIIPDDEIRKYYESNKDQFKDQSFISVRKEIEKYLFEKELNRKLKEHIEELKNNSEVKILFIP